MKNARYNLAIFASGNGTNAQRIIEYFSENQSVRIKLILSNNPDALVLKRAEKFQIPTMVFNREMFYKTGEITEKLLLEEAGCIILAGFLWLIPPSVLNAFPDRIINIHPALLPAFGGKGMYGNRVHEAVIASGEKKTGITIHLVNERYDEGRILFQAECPVLPGDSPDTLAARIHELEYRHFPEVIENFLLSLP